MSAAGEGVRLDFAGRPMARCKHNLEQELIQYISAFETAQKALAAMAAWWPRAQTVTADERIPLAERDVVHAIVTRTHAALAAQRQLLYQAYEQQSALVRAVTQIPTEWSAAQTLTLLERPDLFGLDTEIVEDIETARARGAPWPIPLDSTNPAP